MIVTCSPHCKLEVMVQQLLPRLNIQQSTERQQYLPCNLKHHSVKLTFMSILLTKLYHGVDQNGQCTRWRQSTASSSPTIGQVSYEPSPTSDAYRLPGRRDMPLKTMLHDCAESGLMQRWRPCWDLLGHTQQQAMYTEHLIMQLIIFQGVCILVDNCCWI